MATSVLLTRKWRYAAPALRLYYALADESGQWLEVLDGERVPVMTEIENGAKVLFAPWLVASVGEVEVAIEDDGAGSRATVLLRGEHELAPEERATVKHRVGVVFGDRLRHHIDGL